MNEPTQFDSYVESYDAALGRGLSLTGEGKEYFARRRLEWLRHCLQDLLEHPSRILDYGCGLGSTTPLFIDLFQPELFVGVDRSAKSLDLARSHFGSEKAEFRTIDEFGPNAQLDLIYCNGVFHHIPERDRATTVAWIWRALRPGGIFAFWENNPWNLGTRLVMSRVPFDRDAAMLSAPEARRLLRGGGLEILRTDFQFIFPKFLNRLRRIEAWVSKFPLGGQYQVLCRKR